MKKFIIMILVFLIIGCVPVAQNQMDSGVKNEPVKKEYEVYKLDRLYVEKEWTDDYGNYRHTTNNLDPKTARDFCINQTVALMSYEYCNLNEECLKDKFYSKGAAREHNGDGIFELRNNYRWLYLNVVNRKEVEQICAVYLDDVLKFFKDSPRFKELADFLGLNEKKSAKSLPTNKNGIIEIPVSKNSIKIKQKQER